MLAGVDGTVGDFMNAGFPPGLIKGKSSETELRCQLHSSVNSLKTVMPGPTTSRDLHLNKSNKTYRGTSKARTPAWLLRHTVLMTSIQRHQ